MIVAVPQHRGAVFDANGVELKYAIWADTETGEAVHYVRDEKGFVITVDEAYGEQCLKTEWRQHPAPLRYAPYEVPYTP